MNSASSDLRKPRPSSRFSLPYHTLLDFARQREQNKLRSPTDGKNLEDWTFKLLEHLLHSRLHPFLMFQICLRVSVWMTFSHLFATAFCIISILIIKNKTSKVHNEEHIRQRRTLSQLSLRSHKMKNSHNRQNCESAFETLTEAPFLLKFNRY